MTFSEIQFTGDFKMFRFWPKSKQSKQKGVENGSISIEMEMLLFGQLSSKIIRKIEYKAQSEESPFLLESAVVSASSLRGD